MASVFFLCKDCGHLFTTGSGDFCIKCKSCNVERSEDEKYDFEYEFEDEDNFYNDDLNRFFLGDDEC